ncbi:MAG: DUF6498-containing protein [Candidatus Margulisbacteria bacterium]|nr:DUF6498-containing protein [Candidatus Margulisiibacteriota bacterium]
MKRGFLNSLLSDPSSWSLIGANLTTLILAVTYQWSLLEMMWIYWFQNVIIGFFNFIRMSTATNLSTEGFSFKGLFFKGLPFKGLSFLADASDQMKISYFFALHYGTFHLVYVMFLFGFAVEPDLLGAASPGPILFSALIFFGNHLFSFIYNLGRDEGKRSLAGMMAFPYFRVFPMHLTILVGALIPHAMVLFLLLKTGADLGMHMVEHAGQA